MQRGARAGAPHCDGRQLRLLGSTHCGLLSQQSNAGGCSGGCWAARTAVLLSRIAMGSRPSGRLNQRPGCEQPRNCSASGVVHGLSSSWVVARRRPTASSRSAVLTSTMVADLRLLQDSVQSRVGRFIARVPHVHADALRAVLPEIWVPAARVAASVRLLRPRQPSPLAAAAAANPHPLTAPPPCASPSSPGDQLWSWPTRQPQT